MSMSTVALCVYCEQLPERPPSQAARVLRCPLCKTHLGMTGGGKKFRVLSGYETAPRSARPALIAGLMFAVMCALAAFGYFALARHRAPTPEAPIVVPEIPAHGIARQ